MQGGSYGKRSSRDKVLLVCLTIAEHLVVCSLARFSVEHTKLEIHSTLQQQENKSQSVIEYFLRCKAKSKKLVFEILRETSACTL